MEGLCPEISHFIQELLFSSRDFPVCIRSDFHPVLAQTGEGGEVSRPCACHSVKSLFLTLVGCNQEVIITDLPQRTSQFSWSGLGLKFPWQRTTPCLAKEKHLQRPESSGSPL